MWCRYVYIKQALKTALGKETQITNIEETEEQTAPEEGFLKFLKVANEPYVRILEAWEATYKIRRKQYLNCTLTQLFQDFPCLKLNNGIQLVRT